MAALVALKKRRSTMKGNITKLLKYIKSITDQTDTELIKARLLLVHKLRDEFIATEDKIVELDENEEPDEDFEENYYTIVAGLNHALRLIPEASTSTSETMANASMSGNHTEVKLPKISIPVFSGDYTDWQSFYDLFCSTIHDNQKLTASQKLQYLKGSLKGEAAGLLKHFNITDMNYIEALKKLKERYDRRKHTIYAFIRNFMSQPTVTTANNFNVRRLLDTSDEIIRGLKALGEDAESRDHWLIYIMTNKLDDETNSLWAQESSVDDRPTLKGFFDFLNKRIDALESMKVPNRRVQQPSIQFKPNVRSHAAITTSATPCTICPQEYHKLFECNKFKEMPIAKRVEMLKSENRCVNCLNNNHAVNTCRSRYRCRQCNLKHHSLVHETSPSPKPESDVTVLNTQCITSDPAKDISSYKSGTSLLPTALVQVRDSSNRKQYCRALLDSGSQGSFVSESCAQRLNLHRRNAKFAITGIGASKNGYTRGSMLLTISPWYKEKPNIQIDALILSKLTANQSEVSQPIDMKFLQQYELADPYFNKREEVDMILGADIVLEVLTEGKIITDQLIMQNTLLGWVVVTKSNEDQPRQSTTVTLSNPNENLDNILKQFWEIESAEVPCNILSQEEEFCENHFRETKRVDSSGRFEVRLPFKLSPSLLGDSYQAAIQRMHSIERKFTKDPEFATLYKDFMKEYESLGHMRRTSDLEVLQKGYYLPHHGVIKSSSSTTKLRVVFDGSAKTSSDVSLNDCLAVGPTIQSTLYDILMRFRRFKVAFTSDIEKMFRQIRVAADDTRYQRIIWRNTPSKPFSTYELSTVTYGTASATYLATRALNEATENYKEIHPEAVNQIKTSIYVDDLMSGADTAQEAMRLVQDIDMILSKFGFKLRKWLTNDQTILKTLPSLFTEQNSTLEIKGSDSVKMLGLYWDPKADYFKFKVNLNNKSPNTKRGILSEASRLFDPIGWLAPVTVRAKIFFQTLWIHNLAWDDDLPNDLMAEWTRIRHNLVNLENIKIDRYIGTTFNCKAILHGFSDASRNAYSAVVYIETKTPNGSSCIRLLTAKTKVAPVKQISIPRLELCGALLLSKLILKTKQAMRINISQINAWTDSTIVLSWLAAHPTKWTTFVGNRTGEILSHMSRSQWRHVCSQENPADFASRGLDPDKLKNASLWWNGPQWLKDPLSWPKDIANLPTTTDELRNQSFHAQIPSPNILDDLITKSSNFTKIVRILAYIMRYINLKLKRIPKNSLTPNLLCSELQKSKLIIIRHIQSKCFQFEINILKSKKELPKTSNLRCLQPFYDESFILRVGGRIKNAAITYDVKHPPILPSKERLVELIVREHHEKYLHAGPTLMMATLRQRYWIIRSRSLIRKVIHSCIKCTKYSARDSNQVMGDLPNPRVELVRPFHKVGVDYAGPILTHTCRGRGQKTYKSYICIFVCLATKAVHIELVSDLTTDAYMGALRRFIARRGICTEVHSDNATNFIGARNHLYEFYSFLRKNANYFSNLLLADQIHFKFIPPSSPHFGGLWEAAVKSMKFHLRRVTDGHILTIEEMTTLLTEIEAMLNSRPICVLSCDDLDYLTPGHFLIGRPTTQLPSENMAEVKLSKLSRWQIIQKMNQDIWKRWNLEYLTNLQQKSKWHVKQTNIKIDDVVLIKEINLPPSKWSMGRVVTLHPGTDDNVRVVTIKTQSGNIKRPIHKLCRLPIS